MKYSRKAALPFTEVRDNLTSILDDVQRSGKPVTILRRGKPTAVIISHRTYEEQISKTRPFRLAGSVKVAPGMDIDQVLANAKHERIEQWTKRMKRPRSHH
jgi:prevent-host-death family protein